MKKNKIQSSSSNEITRNIIIVFGNTEPTSTDELYNKLSKLGIDPFDAIQYLIPDENSKEEKVAHPLLQKAVEAHNNMCRHTDPPQTEREIRVDTFNSPKVNHDPTITPTGNRAAVSNRNFMQESNNQFSLRDEIKDLINNNLRWKIKNPTEFNNELNNINNKGGLSLLIQTLSDLILNIKDIKREYNINEFDKFLNDAQTMKKMSEEYFSKYSSAMQDDPEINFPDNEEDRIKPPDSHLKLVREGKNIKLIFV